MKEYKCDFFFAVHSMAKVPITACPKSNWNHSLPMIAIMAASTTRNV